MFSSNDVHRQIGSDANGKDESEKRKTNKRIDKNEGQGTYGEDQAHSLQTNDGRELQL